LSEQAPGAFWSWSLAAYRRDGVAERLLALQDRAGLNVNILLWCCWTAQACTPPAEIHLRKAIDMTRTWSREVTEPIRAARRALNTLAPSIGGQAPVAGAIRDKLKAVELDAERVEQSLLERLAIEQLAQTREAPNVQRAALRSLLSYAELAGAIGREGFATVDLDALARAIFPDAVEASLAG
jgi:uncharacterized protein (TIGR02444 family)